MSDLVVDIETLGIESGSKVLSIGAVANGELFYRVIKDPEGEIDEATLKWWNGCPSERARKEVFEPTDAVSLKDALNDLVTFIKEQNCDLFWGCSPDFDYRHLQYWMEKYQIEVPWRFWQMRDVRTIRDFVPKKQLDVLNEMYIDEDTKHIAIVDALLEYSIVNQFRKNYESKMLVD